METPLLIQQDLYFGSNLPKNRAVSLEQFQTFVNNVITPLFPAGLTIFDADGQFLRKRGTPINEDTNVVSLFVEDTLESEANINKTVKRYNEQYQGAPVLQVTNKDDLKVGFGVGEDLIDNDLVPELIQVDLFFGRNIAGVGEVSQEQFQSFLDSVITPLFPAGLTVFDANGQFQISTGEIIEEQSKVVSLIFEDTEQNEVNINEVVKEYIEQFQQESVLQAVNEDIKVSFGPDDNLIDNDPTPELIQADLFFGRNIAGVGEVSQEQFQYFLDNFVTPLFSRSTVFDALGQFLGSTGTAIQESSKVVSLIFEDTEQNEANINGVVKEYIEQFQQESLLIVVDEDIQANFTGDRNDVIYGKGERDTLIGDFVSDDLIYGGFQAYKNLPGDGNHSIYANGCGNNNGGFDTIWLSAEHATVVLEAGHGYDIINNFNLGATQFKVDSLDSLTFADSPNGAQIFQKDDLLAIVSGQSANTISNIGEIFVV